MSMVGRILAMVALLVVAACGAPSGATTATGGGGAAAAPARAQAPQAPALTPERERLLRDLIAKANQEARSRLR